ncbi:hypothetical protein cym2001_16680 [Pseudomonas sp. CYM-20-01]|nr:hypothetical protein cym2001_16680 [Pseudomonas sp. CYM-20-01]
MIEDPHLKSFQQSFQLLGQYQVVVTGLGAAGRVVVNKDHCGTVMCQCALHDASRIYSGAVDGALKQGLKGKQAMLGVEKQYGKDFVPLAGQCQAQVLSDALRVFKARPALEQPLLQYVEGSVDQVHFVALQL